MTSKYALILSAALLASPAWSETYACQFTVECYDTEACQETEFDLSITTAEDASAQISSVIGDMTGTVQIGQDEQAKSLVVTTPIEGGAVHVISIFDAMGAGHARYTTHQGNADAAFSITYMGMCKGSK